MRSPIRRFRGIAAASAAIAATVLVFGSAGAAVTPAAATVTGASARQLANGVKHVIEITFDNVHYNRDNPNVLSDLSRCLRWRISSPARARSSRTTTPR